MQNNNEYGSYPNTEFPYKYTKAGQKAMMEKYTMGESYNTPVITDSKPTEPKTQNIDMSKILPLLMNKNLSSHDLLEMILPMINKNSLPRFKLLRPIECRSAPGYGGANFVQFAQTQIYEQIVNNL